MSDTEIVNIVILGDDLTTAEQIQVIANLPSPPSITPCASLDEDDESDGTSPGCCTVSPETAALLKTWAKANDKTIKNIFVFVQSKKADTAQALRSYPVAYFFYGRLCDPALWTGRVGFADEPKLVEGQIRGYEIKMWGDYKALVPASELEEEGENVLRGKVYMIESEEVLEKLAAYETNNYGMGLCEITFGDGRTAEGCVFAFQGDLGRLKTVEEYELEQKAFAEFEGYR